MVKRLATVVAAALALVCLLVFSGQAAASDEMRAAVTERPAIVSSANLNG